MKLVWILSFLFLSSCSSNANEIAVENDNSFPYNVENQKILFIGNSFTFYWNLPSQIEKMSIERGLNWNVTHFTVPSATLKIHWNNPDLISLLENEIFDHIIVQEHSTNILTNADGNSKFYFDQIRSIIPVSTQIHFFSTWMYPSMEQFNIDNEEYPIEKRIKEIIEGTTTKLIPVGSLGNALGTSRGFLVRYIL